MKILIQDIKLTYAVSDKRPGEVRRDVSAVTVPANMAEALRMVEYGAGFMADADTASMPTDEISQYLHGLERTDAVCAVARGRLLAAHDAKDGPVADGQRTIRVWLVNCLRVTRGQAAEYLALLALALRAAPAQVLAVKRYNNVRTTPPSRPT